MRIALYASYSFVYSRKVQATLNFFLEYKNYTLRIDQYAAYSFLYSRNIKGFSGKLLNIRCYTLRIDLYAAYSFLYSSNCYVFLTQKPPDSTNLPVNILN